MTVLSLSVVGAPIFLSSFISGVFGLAGGMILLGALLTFFDVPTSMVLFSLLSTTGNLWRVFSWRRYIDWRIWLQYVAGAAVAFAVLRFIAFVPSKALVYLLLGLMPYMIELLPRHWHPSIQWRGIPVFTGFVTSAIQLFAGNGGMFLDVFFQKSQVDPRTTVPTKSFCQTDGNLLRILYFGSLDNLSAIVPVWALAPASALAVAGTMLAPWVLERMTDHGFRGWTRKLIFTVSAVYLVRAAWLYWRGF